MIIQNCDIALKPDCSVITLMFDCNYIYLSSIWNIGDEYIMPEFELRRWDYLKKQN